MVSKPIGKGLCRLWILPLSGSTARHGQCLVEALKKKCYIYISWPEKSPKFLFIHQNKSLFPFCFHNMTNIVLPLSPTTSLRVFVSVDMHSCAGSPFSTSNALARTPYKRLTLANPVHIIGFDLNSIQLGFKPNRHDFNSVQTCFISPQPDS